MQSVKENKNQSFIPGFPTKLKGVRISRGMSQVEFARLLGVTPGAVCNWEKGVNGPSERKLAAIAHTLKVPFDYFVTLPGGARIVAETKIWPPIGMSPEEGHQQIDEYCKKLRSIARVKPKVARTILLLIEEIENSLHPAMQTTKARRPFRRKNERV